MTLGGPNNEESPYSEQRLNLNLGGIDNSTNPKLPKDFNNLKTIRELANIWVERGYYADTGQAYKALVEGVTE
jgi:hypothetical protein